MLAAGLPSPVHRAEEFVCFFSTGRSAVPFSCCLQRGGGGLGFSRVKGLGRGGEGLGFGIHGCGR